MKLAINVIYAFSVIDLILLVGFPPSNIRVWGNINLLIKGILVSSHLKKKGLIFWSLNFFVDKYPVFLSFPSFPILPKIEPMSAGGACEAGTLTSVTLLESDGLRPALLRPWASGIVPAEVRQAPPAFFRYYTITHC